MNIGSAPKRWIAAAILLTCTATATAVPFILTPSVVSVAPGGRFSVTLSYQSAEALGLGMDFTVGASPSPVASHVTLAAIESLTGSIANASIQPNPLLPGGVPNVVSLAIDTAIGGEVNPVAHELLRFDFVLDSTAPSELSLDITLAGFGYTEMNMNISEVSLQELARIEVTALPPGGQVPEGNILITLLTGLAALAWARHALLRQRVI